MGFSFTNDSYQNDVTLRDRKSGKVKITATQRHVLGNIWLCDRRNPISQLVEAFLFFLLFPIFFGVGQRRFDIIDRWKVPFSFFISLGSSRVLATRVLTPRLNFDEKVISTDKRKGQGYDDED
jgi:hypothetical protein